MELDCAPDHVNISTGSEGLGIFLLIASVLVPLPQVLKLMYRRSSAGVNPSTICLCLGYTATNFAATAAMKWRQLEACAAVGPCLVEMLDALQVLTSPLMWLSILVPTVFLPPHNTRRWRNIAAGVVLSVIALWLTIFAVSAAEPCGLAAKGLAQFAAWASALLTVVAFAPQLRTIWRTKSAGSVSLVFMFLIAAGGIPVAANQIFGAHEPWPVWFPQIVAIVMQSAIFWLAFHYKGCRGECGRAEPAAAGSADEQFLSSTARCHDDVGVPAPAPPFAQQP